MRVWGTVFCMLTLGFMFTQIVLNNELYEYAQKQIAISREREEILAQAVKTLSYQLDVLTTTVLNER